MALRLAEIEPREYVYICTPTRRELPEMIDHWARLEQILGKPLLKVTHHTLDYWIRKWEALPNFRMRWCTRELKIDPMIAWLKAHQPCTHYVGLRADEETREGIYGEVATYTDHPLRRWGWRKADVIAYNLARGVTIPTRTDCDVCFFQRISEWKALLRRYPERYAEGESYETLTGATFRTPGRDSWPVSMKALREAIERQPDLNDIDAEGDRGATCRACTL